MPRVILTALVAVLLLPAAALAAPAKISPNAPAVSDAGDATVEVANPNPYVLRGKASLAAGGRKVASRSVRLGKRSVSEVRLFVGTAGVDALRAAGGRATLTLKLSGRGRASTARRALTFTLPGGPPAPAAPQGDVSPAPAAQTRWVGRMGTEGDYDDFELTIENGQMTLTKPALVPVSCFENGGGYASALSFELFDAMGPWAVGADGSTEKQGIAVNQLVHGGTRTITYKVEGLTQDAGRVTGKLAMSYSDSQYDVFSASITFVNCFGSQSFEAIPA
ncbi:MAG TPA: hypothetical protein VF587_02850 [Solirubrobacteraceae bacterium]|jgi:hypothetical protein